MSIVRARLVVAAMFVMFFAVAANMLIFQGGDRAPARTASHTLASADSAEPVPTLSSPTHGTQTREEAPSPSPANDVQTRGFNALVTSVQRELRQAGYEPGDVDGIVGLTTSAAVLAYQYDHGLPLTAEASDELLEALILGMPRVADAGGRPLGPRASQIVATVQSSLERLGFRVGGVDGRIGPMTRSAIQQFESKSGLEVSGRVSAPLIRALGSSRVSGQMSLATN